MVSQTPAYTYGPDIPRVCIDRYLPPEVESNSLRAVRPPSLAGLIAKLWPNGKTILVGFLGGDSIMQNKVRQYADQWSNYANIKFEFGSRPPSQCEVRVAFDTGGSWSYIGTDALAIPTNQPTMNYGWLTPRTEDAEYSRVVIHEFGHALGMIHEHQSPVASIPWDVEAVYRYYGGPPNNWSRADIDANLLAKYDQSITRFSEFDPTSIMCYPVSNALTLGDYEIGWNTVLSPTDKQYVNILYPMPAPPPPAEKFAPPTAGTPERAIWDNGFQYCWCHHVDPNNPDCH